MGIKPSIRFWNNPPRLLCQQLAVSLQSILEQMTTSRGNGNSTPGLNLTTGTSTLLILDRSIDAATCLLHEYTYQALAYDIIDIPCGTSLNEKRSNLVKSVHDDTFEYEVASNDHEKPEIRFATLGDHDQVYEKYKHQHITVVNKSVAQEIKQFMADNVAVTKTRAGEASNQEAMAAVRALPQYGQMFSKFWLHVTLSEMCLKELQKQGVMKAGAVEQHLGTGVDSEGKPVASRTVLTQIGNLLTDPSVSPSERLRMILLYFSCMDYVNDDARRKMISAAQLPLDLQTCAQRFVSLGLHTSDELPPPEPGQIAKHQHKFTNNKERLQFFQRRAKAADFELSRFEPFVKDLMEKLVSRTLPTGTFPFVEDDGRRRNVVGGTANDAGGGGGGTAANIRARLLDWDWGTSSPSGDSQPGDGGQPGGNGGGGGNKKKDVLTDVEGSGGHKFIVFVLGGITMAEMRCCYEVSKQARADVYLGGSGVVTPSKLLETLKSRPVSGMAHNTPQGAALTGANSGGSAGQMGF